MTKLPTLAIGSLFLAVTAAANPGGSLCVGPNHCPVLFMSASSKDLPTTPGA